MRPHTSIISLAATPLTRTATASLLFTRARVPITTALSHRRGYAEESVNKATRAFPDKGADGAAQSEKISGSQQQVNEMLEGIVSGAMKGIRDTQAAQQASQIGKKKGESAIEELTGASPDEKAGAEQRKHMAMNALGRMVPEDQVFAQVEMEPEGQVFGKGDPHEGKSM